MTDHYIGEGYYFRAHFYYELFKQFGALPIITKPVDADDVDILYGARNSRTEVANFILSDLDMAISKMKHGSELATHGTRLSKDIALLFKARVALYIGTWEKYHSGTVFAGSTDGSGYIEQARDAAKQVMDDANYSLITGDPNSVYMDMFNLVDYSNHPEVLFYKHYDRETYGSDFSNQLWNWPNAYGITQDLTDIILCTDGLPTAVSPLFVGDIFCLLWRLIATQGLPRQLWSLVISEELMAGIQPSMNIQIYTIAAPVSNHKNSAI